MCKVNHTISDPKPVDVVVGQPRALLTHPEAFERLSARFEERFLSRQKMDTKGVAAAEKRVTEHQRRVANLMTAVADLGYSPHFREQLQREEAALGEAQKELVVAKRASRPKTLPHPTLIKREIEDLLAVTEGPDIEKAREKLARFTPPVIVKREPNGWKITGASTWPSSWATCR